MEEYIKWLENKIEVSLEDKDLQREHWAFCQALSKYRELALRQPPVSGSLPTDDWCTEDRHIPACKCEGFNEKHNRLFKRQ